MTLMPSPSSGGVIHAEPTGRTTSCSAPTPATKSTNGFDHSTIASESAGSAVERKAYPSSSSVGACGSQNMLETPCTLARRRKSRKPWWLPWFSRMTSGRLMLSHRPVPDASSMVSNPQAETVLSARCWSSCRTKTSSRTFHWFSA